MSAVQKIKQKIILEDFTEVDGDGEDKFYFCVPSKTKKWLSHSVVVSRDWSFVNCGCQSFSLWHKQEKCSHIRLVLGLWDRLLSDGEVFVIRKYEVKKDEC